ncbi:MAG: hypothetical protein HC884_09460 [Chloroflexaceae bacterium]|nr:hypothetical protein [Chloroflexaceae bacterium]
MEGNTFLFGIVLAGGIFIGYRIGYWIAVIRSKLLAPPSPEGTTFVVNGQYLQPVEPARSSGGTRFITTVLFIGLGMVLVTMAL